jgi:hypothetical protein
MIMNRPHACGCRNVDMCATSAFTMCIREHALVCVCHIAMCTSPSSYKHAMECRDLS